MAEQEFEPPSVSMANTKKEILEAYHEILDHLEERRESEMKPEERAEERATRAAVEVADSLSTEGIVQGIGALRAEVGRLLTDLSDRLESEIVRYRQVRRATEAREKDLKEIYEIERSASSLAALIEVQQRKRQEAQVELVEERAELEREIETTRAEWEEERERHEAHVKERDAADRRRRERDKEEYDYAFQREQQLARETFEDEKARMERDLERRREEMERDLAERERAVAEGERELAQLRERVAAFPGELEVAVGQAVEAALERVQREAQSREDLLAKEFEGERNVLNTRIEALEKTVKEQTVQLAKLAQQSEKAYSQVQDIALKAIEGTARARSQAYAPPSGGEPARKASEDD